LQPNFNHNFLGINLSACCLNRTYIVDIPFDSHFDETGLEHYLWLINFVLFYFLESVYDFLFFSVILNLFLKHTFYRSFQICTLPRALAFGFFISISFCLIDSSDFPLHFIFNFHFLIHQNLKHQ
jgi:hypothetical protein